MLALCAAVTRVRPWRRARSKANSTMRAEPCSEIGLSDSAASSAEGAAERSAHEVADLGQRRRAALELEPDVEVLGVLAHHHQVDARERARGSRQRARGRTLANKSSSIRSMTLTERKPSPIGVESGPLSPTRLARSESSTRGGSGVPSRARTAAPGVLLVPVERNTGGVDDAAGRAHQLGADPVAGDHRDAVALPDPDGGGVAPKYASSPPARVIAMSRSVRRCGTAGLRAARQIADDERLAGKQRLREPRDLELVAERHRRLAAARATGAEHAGLDHPPVQRLRERARQHRAHAECRQRERHLLAHGAETEPLARDHEPAAERAGTARELGVDRREHVIGEPVGSRRAWARAGRPRAGSGRRPRDRRSRAARCRAADRRAAAARAAPGARGSRSRRRWDRPRAAAGGAAGRRGGRDRSSMRPRRPRARADRSRGRGAPRPRQDSGLATYQRTSRPAA